MKPVVVPAMREHMVNVRSLLYTPFNQAAGTYGVLRPFSGPTLLPGRAVVQLRVLPHFLSRRSAMIRTKRAAICFLVFAAKHLAFDISGS